jgi:hypothetical protein
LKVRLRNWLDGLLALWTLRRPASRVMWAEMRAFARGLPDTLNQPLPEALAAHTPGTVDLALPEMEVRRLADAAALFERGSPLGLCLRRSLLRYHFMRRAGVPLAIHFGARFKPGLAGAGHSQGPITGHAWVTLRGQPYFEDGENYRGFAEMFVYPNDRPSHA